MLEAKIVNTGRGPEIAGTRITVYDVISTRSHAPAWERGCAAVGNTQRSPLGVPCSSRCVVAHSDRTPERRRRHSHAGAWERGRTAVGNTQGIAMGFTFALGFFTMPEPAGAPAWHGLPARVQGTNRQDARATFLPGASRYHRAVGS
jgi:hypothetical protein